LKSLRRIFIKLIFLFFILAGLFISWFFQELNLKNNSEEDKLVFISAGSSINSISNKLYDNGLINNRFIFNVKARFENKEAPLKAGEYLFPAHLSIKDIIKKLQSGKTHYYHVMIAEGLTSQEVVNLLNKNKILEGNIDVIPEEGSLLPETYNFSKGDSRKTIIKHMQESMVKEVDNLWLNREKISPIKTKKEAIILASIVEKETALTEERPRIAGVFINRLNRKIPLQTDPTVIYSITMGRKKLDRRLTYKDLKNPSPYNTYLVQGLPPTPIANPGKDSIKAVLNPEKNKYIYFVANGKGGHVFAKTLKAHNNNVKNWRKIEKNIK